MVVGVLGFCEGFGSSGVCAGELSSFLDDSVGVVKLGFMRVDGVEPGVEALDRSSNHEVILDCAIAAAI